MSRYISDKLRREVATRAVSRCEYCGLDEDVAFFDFQVDHIISLKHGGETVSNNLSWACYSCNLYKGSDIGTVLLPEKTFIRLFDPRNDRWKDHFEIFNGVIQAKTLIGEATIKVLRMNEVERIIERQGL
ncbi:MAG: HNH endonuclease signature motif containing protein [Saprospiraceae bacterium]